MSFLMALRHAFIGYGIRRKSWNDNRLTLVWEDDELRFLQSGPQDAGLIWSWTDLNISDLNATDWETI